MAAGTRFYVGDSSEPEKCRAVNVDGTRNIAEACKEIGAKMLYISTDYVFPGTGDHFYEPDSQTGPLGVYGESKLGGEFAVKELLERYFIVRTSLGIRKEWEQFCENHAPAGGNKNDLMFMGGRTIAG